MSTRQSAFPMTQLSAKPSELRGNLFKILNFMRVETVIMGAVLVKLCRRSGDVWQGFDLQTIYQHAGDDAHPTSEDGGLRHMLQSPLVVKAGIEGLCQAGVAVVECHRDSEVLYPTEALVAHIRQYT